MGNIEDRQVSDKCQDRTKDPVSRLVYDFETRTAIHKLPDFIDTWERVKNALSPTPPFPEHSARLILAAWLVPLVLMAHFATAYIMMKGIGFMVGFVLFGKPVIVYGFSCLSGVCPYWRDYLELRNTILRGVPTNSQLAITLLRRGESERMPLPPPPEPEGSLDLERSFNACDLTHLGMLLLVSDDLSELELTCLQGPHRKKYKEPSAICLEMTKNKTQKKRTNPALRAVLGSV